MIDQNKDEDLEIDLLIAKSSQREGNVEREKIEKKMNGDEKSAYIKSKEGREERVLRPETAN